jgi:hypothetical protein
VPPQHRYLDILGIRRGTDTDQSENAPDDQNANVRTTITASLSDAICAAHSPDAEMAPFTLKRQLASFIPAQRVPDLPISFGEGTKMHEVVPDDVPVDVCAVLPTGGESPRRSSRSAASRCRRSWW